MPATSREQNVARIEGIANTVWQEAYDRLLVDLSAVERLDDECEKADKILSSYPRAQILLNLAAAKFMEEAVRRGIIPEQEIEP